MGWSAMGMAWPMWLLMLAGIGAFWVVVAIAVRGIVRDPDPEPRGEDPLTVLDGRLARGEIDMDQYLRLRRALTEHR